MKHTKRLLAILLTLVLLLSSASLAFAEDAEVVANGVDGNISWTLDSEGTLTINGTGDMYCYGDSYYNKNNAPWGGQYCSQIKIVVIEEGVTSIGDYAFYGCSNLTSVTIGESVTSIGESAFGRCSSLTRVETTDLAAWSSINFWSDGTGSSNPLCYTHELYLNGMLVTDLVIPDGVTNIGGSAFDGCSSLTSVSIPDSVTNIGWRAFHGCSGLTSVTIGNSVTSIDGSAFDGCSSLTSVTIPSSVTSIGYSAFFICSNLTSVTIGNNVTSIGGRAFEGCNSLTDVYYDGSVINFLFIDISEGNLPLKKANFHFHEHEIAEVTSVTPATCTQPGVKTGVCSCGQTLTEKIPALGHSYVTIVTPATCTAIGYTICECERGDHRYVADFENALGHTDADANGNCTRCGVHLKDVTPTSDSPTEPTTQPEPQPEPEEEPQLNFFQRIIAWFQNLFARLFGRA